MTSSAAPSLAPSRSEFLRARGLRHHIRCWGDRSAPKVFLGHGLLDVSATFQPLVEPLLDRWQVLAPDWRGFGYTEWPQDGYWFHDYVGDLEAIADHFAPGERLRLVGHSMGSQIMSLYAGLRPAQVQKLVLLDGITLPDMPATLAPQRFRKWLDHLRDPVTQRNYPSFDDLAARIRRKHPQLGPEQALFVARCWGREDGHGRITLLADPRHLRNGPGLYHAADSDAIWREVTAPTLFVDAGKSEFANVLTPEQRSLRRANFRDHRSVRVEDAGHMLHFDRPVETTKLIAYFLAG